MFRQTVDIYSARSDWRPHNPSKMKEFGEVFERKGWWLSLEKTA
jgi:hypothetical protein